VFIVSAIRGSGSEHEQGQDKGVYLTVSTSGAVSVSTGATQWQVTLAVETGFSATTGSAVLVDQTITSGVTWEQGQAAVLKVALIHVLDDASYYTDASFLVTLIAETGQSAPHVDVVKAPFVGTKKTDWRPRSISELLMLDSPLTFEHIRKQLYPPRKQTGSPGKALSSPILAVTPNLFLFHDDHEIEELFYANCV